MLTARELEKVVWDRFDGLAPMREGEVDLGVIVMAVLEELQRLHYIDLEVPDAS